MTKGSQALLTSLSAGLCTTGLGLFIADSIARQQGEGVKLGLQIGKRSLKSLVQA